MPSLFSCVWSGANGCCRSRRSHTAASARTRWRKPRSYGMPWPAHGACVERHVGYTAPRTVRDERAAGCFAETCKQDEASGFCRCAATPRCQASGGAYGGGRSFQEQDKNIGEQDKITLGSYGSPAFVDGCPPPIRHRFAPRRIVPYRIGPYRSAPPPTC